jgi:hypothetical protein
MGFKHMDIEDYAMKRIEQRERDRHGERIRVGGDMYERHLKFIDFAATRSLTAVEQWADTLSCPVVHIDGTAAIEENALQVMRQYSPKYISIF